jgi:glycine cleavage system H lipoate-binding protein/ABC-type phosphate transport system substrate-binding protein
MKKIIILLISLLLINYSFVFGIESLLGSTPATGDSIIVLSTPDLKNLTNKWASEFNGLYPEVKIKVMNFSDTKIVDNLIKGGNIAFVSNKYYSGFNSQSLWRVVVGRDVIVPVMNSKNPFVDEIYQHGISPEAFIRFFKNPNSKKWGTLLNNSQDKPVNYYWINDESIKTGLTDFLNVNQTMIGGIEVENGEKMISAIQTDPAAIGFCKMINVLDFKNQKIVENIKVLPIDRNGNGIIDYNEKIYDDLNVFTRGVWIGKYPKPLFSNIYSISTNQPTSEKEISFLKWILTDGQQFLYNNGYSDLLITERQTSVDKLYTTRIYPSVGKDDSNLTKTGLLILAALIVTGLILDVIIRYIRRKKASVQYTISASQNFINENSLIVPKGLYFDKTHTWAFMEQDGVAKIGIDDFLQHITGPITKIKLKNNGDFVKKGEKIMSIIQNGKQLNLYSPISGSIKEHNKALETNSSEINSSPYNKGWIYMIEPTNWHRENQLLFMADKQKQFLKNEFSRLKDFLAVTFKTDTEKYANVILQDGGELRDGILSNLGPEVWEDFQTNFIDPSRQLWFYEIF